MTRSPQTQTPTHAAIVLATLVPVLFAVIAYYFNVLMATLVVAVVVAVAAARAVLVAWVTVLVVLTFVGNRRRVLAREGRKITAEVGSYLLRVTISERKGACTTFACAAVVSVYSLGCIF